MEKNTRVTNIYFTTLLLLGTVAVAWAVRGIRVERFDFVLGGLAILTLVFGSYLRIQLPRTKIHLTLSDTLIFVCFLMYGAEPALLLGSLEAAISSLNFRRKGVPMRLKTVVINVIITALSIASMAIAVTFIFGDPELIRQVASVKEMVVVLGVMAIAQFLVNSLLVSTFISIRSGETLWHVWNEYCFNALVMYLTGAFMAGVVTTALNQIDPFLLGVVGLFFCLVYLTYVRYVNDIKRTSAVAEQAERERAEEAESHVGELRHYVGELEKTADALRESRERFRHAAYHDALTGLANRNQFIELLEPYLAGEEGKRDTHFAVLFLDLNRFKTVNDSLGHSVGDMLIVNVAKRLQNVVGDNGVVGRLSGDEFVVLLTDVSKPAEAVVFAEWIDQRISAPYDLDGRLIFTSVSIGIAMGDARYNKPDEVLRDADIAMYYAKETNQSHVIFDQIMHARAVTLLELETDLRFAVERDEFELFYQPLVHLDDVSLMGFEALVRWNHPRRGLVTPGEFISVAESTGLIIPMTVQLLRRACEQAASWIRDGVTRRSMVISVNISASHLTQGDLVVDLKQILDETKLDPASLKLEITESAVMDNAESVISVLRSIKELGVKLSIDDFGTGYSSLSYLHRFPIDTLKVDRSFVSAMEDSSGNGEIVRTVIALANALQLSVIAEGIESIEQFHRLRALGCEYGQGYLFSKPVPVLEAHRMLEAGFNWRHIVEPKAEYTVVARPVEFGQAGVH
jgi:diguanylate cyclase (GGDEF)-like protein